jgi:hypothetical protein
MPYSQKAHNLFALALHNAKVRKERGLSLQFVKKAVGEGVKKVAKKKGKGKGGY